MAGGMVADRSGGLASNAVKQNRRKWTETLREAQWWLDEAHKIAKRGDYAESRKHVRMVCATLDYARQYETEPKE